MSGHDPGMDFDPRTPFLRRTALGAGVSAKELRGPGYRLVLPGTFVAATTVITPRVRARAALLPYDGVAWASHASAARVYDLPIPTIADANKAALISLGKRVSAYGRSAELGPLAIVARSDAGHEAAQIYVASAVAARAIRIFRELHAARAWLDGPHDQ